MTNIADLEQIVLIPDGLGPYSNVIYDQMREQGMGAVYLGKITAEDIEAGWSCVGATVCEPVAGLIGQFVRYFDGHGVTPNTAIIIPDICPQCVSVDIADLSKLALAEIGAKDVELMVVTNFELAQSAARVFDVAKRKEEAGETTVGICGSPAVHAMSALRKPLIKELNALGWHAELPPLTCVFGKDNSLEESFAYFEHRGIHKVIYMVPSACEWEGASFAQDIREFQGYYEKTDILSVSSSLVEHAAAEQLTERLKIFIPALAQS